MNTNNTRRAIEILLVEDSPTDRLIAVEALERSHLLNSLNVVENGVDAMAYLRREGKYAGARRPDIVLLDLNLPKKDGREVLSEMKADSILKYIPVIVLTTSQSDEDLLRSYGDHANSYITKPVDFPRFSEALSALGGYWFEVVTLPPEGAIERLARSEPPRQAPPARTLDGQVRVLVVEDNPVDLELLREALDRSRLVEFQMGHAASLAEARQKLRAEAFDLVMTDLALPDSRGLDTYRQVRRAAPGLPVIVLTGLEDDDTGLNALREGAQDYLVKGQLTPRALARAARYAIDKKDQQEQLRQSQRLEAVGRLAAGVAHDFNNIMAVVRGNAELIAQETDRAAVALSITEIQEATERAIALARQLLTFSRQQVMSLAPLDLNDVVGNFTRMLRRLLGEPVRLELRLAAELPAVLADVGTLEQVLLNLAVNARDAMPAGGKLKVQTASVELTPASARGYTDGYAGSFVQLSVSDTGGGIEPEVLARIFEPFFSTKGPGRGTGLGLSTVYGIVQQHRGWLNVTSRVGSGTTFEIFLPVSNEAVMPKATATPVQPRRGSETLLLVEDEPALLALTAKVLRRAGYTVLEASCARDALAHWSDAAERIDLVLTDLVLPDGESGRKLVERLVGARRDLKVVFTSGYSPDFGKDEFPLHEGINFVAKPYPLAQLLSTIRKRLDGAGASEPAPSAERERLDAGASEFAPNAERERPLLLTRG